MSAFKQHCSFGFWLATHLPDPHHILEKVGKTSMGSLGKIMHISELPERSILIDYIRTAIDLSVKGVNSTQKTPASKKWEKSSLDFPELFADSQKQAISFDALSVSKRKEYITWIEEAKTDQTKIKRIQTMMENLLESKSLHWKYNKK